MVAAAEFAVQALHGWADTVDEAWLQAGAPPRDPVIIVAGTNSPGFYYDVLANRLRADGYDVHIYQLKGLGNGDIADTAKDFAAFVDQVRAETGAAEVDLVGHSQGGLVARQYVKFEGGADHVDSLIGLGTPNHGTEVANAVSWLPFPSIAQMAEGSEFLNRLNEGDDTIGDVRYTSFYPSHDELVVPAASAALDDGAINIRIQDQQPLDLVDHLALPFDPIVENGVEDALRGEPIDMNH